MNAQADRAENIIIVPSGFSPYFYFLCEVFAREQQATIVRDRRMFDRRVQRPVRRFGDRRSGHRRGPTPASWRAGNFIWLPADA
jgi:hypothetical protein